MQYFTIKKFSVTHYFFPILSVCLLASYSPAQAEESQNIHIEWAYDNSQDAPVDGFHLYKENSVVCSTSDPAARHMDCNFESPYGTFVFYLSAYSADSVGPLSAPFSFTLQAPAPLGLVAEITTNISSGEIPLTVTLDAGGSQGAINYMWSFGDGTPAIWTQESHTTHTYETAGQYAATVTVTDYKKNTDTNSLIIVATTGQEVPPEPDESAAPTGFILMQVVPE